MFDIIWSLIFSKNKRGPSTLPCGAPESTVATGDEVMRWVWLLKKSEIQLSKLPQSTRRPLHRWWRDMCSREICTSETMSNALEKSYSTLSVCDLSWCFWLGFGKLVLAVFHTSDVPQSHAACRLVCCVFRDDFEVLLSGNITRTVLIHEAKKRGTRGETLLWI